MKYVILIHSNPRPWGHPTSDYVPEHQALPAEERARLNREFEDAFADMMERGEFVSAEALGDPSTSRLFRWVGSERLATDGPYAEGKEHLAVGGFWAVDAARGAGFTGFKTATTEELPAVSAGVVGSCLGVGVGDGSEPASGEDVEAALGGRCASA